MTKLKFFASIVVFFLTFNLAQAQSFGQGQRKSPEERAETITVRMGEEIGLSQEQKADVYDIVLEGLVSRGNLRQSVMAQEITREEARAKNDSIRTQQDEAIKALLTEEQLPKYEDFKQKAEENARNRFQNRKEKEGEGKKRRRP